jgi:hypothetical protein
MVGNFGNAILFVSFGVAFIVVAAYSLALAARSYLVVVEGTAAGLDRVEWPDELILDWLMGSLWPIGLTVIWLALAFVIERILTRAGVEDPYQVRWFLLLGGALWLCFPISLLSGLTSSPWAIVSPRLLARLVRLLPALLVFYAASGLLLALLGLLLYGGLMTRWWVLLLVAAILGSAILLIHARLVGRLAWLIDQLDRKPAPARRKAAPGKPARKRPRPPRAVSVNDPWAMPPADEPEPEPEISQPTYGLAEEQAPAPPLFDIPDPAPYSVAGTEDVPRDKPSPRHTRLEEHAVQREIELRERAPTNPPPASPLFSGVYSFPGYATSQKAWFWLALWGLATLALFRAMLFFLPRG